MTENDHHEVVIGLYQALLADEWKVSIVGHTLHWKKDKKECTYPLYCHTYDNDSVSNWYMRYVVDRSDDE